MNYGFYLILWSVGFLYGIDMKDLEDVNFQNRQYVCLCSLS